MRVQLHHRLILMTVTVVVCVIVGLASYLSSKQIGVLTEALRQKVSTYGTIMADGTRSAVAFSDRETARETLSALERDPEVASVTLHGEHGVVLYRRGERELSDSRVAGVVETSSRIAIVTDVVSLEGPRGQLEIEVSTHLLDVAREDIVVGAVVAGVFALLASVLVAWAIARRLSRRLRRIAAAAAVVAQGDLEHEPLHDRGSDEIGTLARAFDTMLGQLRLLIERQAEMARREQERLETIVAERTEELDRRNAEMRLVFDHVDQGFLIVDRAGVVGVDRSAVVDRWLPPAGTRFSDYVRGFDLDAADWIDLQWDMLRDGALPAEICLAQLPARFEVGGRHLELAYQPITDAAGELRVLVVVTDASARLECEHAEQHEREVSTLIARMLRGGAGFVAFHAEATSYVAAIAHSPNGTELRRTIHTLKGIVALEGIGSLATLCHDLETALADQNEDSTAALRAAIAHQWETITAKIDPLLRTLADRIDVRAEDLDRLEQAVAQHDTHELRELVRMLRHERVAQPLERLAEDARNLAKRLGKGPIDVRVEVDQTMRLPTERWAGFWSTAIHAVRNAVDHGLEQPDERLAKGKRLTPCITLRARRRAGAVEVEISDDGRGIDWTALAKSASSRGLPSASQRDLIEALFADGISTRTELTETSGRGIGMAALRHSVISSGGSIDLATSPSGTTLAFVWPEAPISTTRVYGSTAYRSGRIELHADGGDH